MLRKRMSAMLLAAAMVLTAMPMTASAAKDDWKRINVQGERSAMYAVAAKEYAKKGTEVEVIYGVNAKPGDITVETDGDEAVYGSEGYEIKNEGNKVVVKAAADAGAVNGLRNVLKQIESGAEVEDGVVQPSQEVRALFVDCGRKYFSLEWFESIIREMAWNGMNTLYVSFSNDEGFRFLLDDMSVTFEDAEGNPKTYDHEFMKHLGDNPANIADSEFLQQRNEGAQNVADKVIDHDGDSRYLTQDEMVKLLTYARAYGINVIPELNSPGHTGQILWYFPEYRNVGIWGIASNPCYALNLENQEAKNFTTALVKKYIDFFKEQGCTDFCVGGDEFAAHGSTNETIAAYVNNLVDYVESKGMTAYAWVDGQSVKSGLLKKSVIVNDWNSNGSTAQNYKVVNFNSNVLYYVFKSFKWEVDPKAVFETWTPLNFSGGTLAADAEETKNVLGAAIAIWCDNPNNRTEDKVLEDMMTDLKAFGYRVWNYDPAAAPSMTYEEFKTKATSAAALTEDEVLGAVQAAADAAAAESGLAAAKNALSAASAAASKAQKDLDAAQAAVTAAQAKVSAAASEQDKLNAEAELAAARAEENKLYAVAATARAAEAKKKAALAELEAQILTLDGSTTAAREKQNEVTQQNTLAKTQETIASEKAGQQAALDKAAADKKTAAQNYKPAPAETTVTLKKVDYRILNKGKKTAAVTGTKVKTITSAVIAPTVKIGGVSYKVTQIDAKAFKGCKKLKKVTVGANVRQIGKEAFAQCKLLKTINLKKAVNISSIKAKAFSKVNAKAKVTVPAKKLAKYTKLLKKAGLPKTAKVKK